MNPIPVTWCAAGALAAAALGFAGGWQVNGWRHDAKQTAALAKQQAAYEKRIATINETAADYERSRETARVEYRDREGQVRTIYETVEVPAVCEPGADALRVLDGAIASVNSDPG
jgi:hypothetical protein